MRTFTKFESAVIDLVVWLLEGLKGKKIKPSAANRILRATIRKIKPRIIGESKSSKKSSKRVGDHAVPLKVIVSKLRKAGPLKERVESILDRYLVKVWLTKYEHTKVLRKAGLEEKMPQGWDGKDLFARYKQARIEIEPISPTPASKS